MLATLLPGHFPSALHSEPSSREGGRGGGVRSRGEASERQAPACTCHHLWKCSCPTLALSEGALGHASPGRGCPAGTGAQRRPGRLFLQGQLQPVSRSARGQSSAAPRPLPPPLALISLPFLKGFVCTSWLGALTLISFCSSSVKLAVGCGDSWSAQGRRGRTMAPPRQPPQR